MRTSLKTKLTGRSLAAEAVLCAAPQMISHAVEVLLVGDAHAPSLGAGYRVRHIDDHALWSPSSAASNEDHHRAIAGVIVNLKDHARRLDLCRRLRSTPRAAGWPIIALVADAREARETLAAGADEFCLAAHAAAEFEARLAHCLERHEQAALMRARASLGAAQARIDRLLHAHLQIENALDEITAEIAAAVRAEACGILVFDEEASEALHRALVTRAGNQAMVTLKVDQVRLHPDAGIAAYQPLMPVFDGVPRDSHAPLAEMVWPLVCGDWQLGVLACAVRGEFDATLRIWLDEIASTLGAALINARLYRRAQQTSQQLVAEVGERQAEIERQKRLTEKVIDSLPVSLYVVDRQLRIVAWNRNREVGGQGIDRQRVIGRSVVDIFSKMPRQMLEQEFERVFVSGESLRFEQESKVDGEVRYWQISKIPMRLDGESGEVTHVITLGEEITEQKKMNEAILHAEKLTGIGRLASGVVHEINNPLATIAACAEALQGRLSEAPMLPAETQADFHEYLKIVHDETFRCKTITNSLLEFSRQRQAEKTELDVNYLVDQTLALVKHHPKFKRLQILKEAGADLAPVLANEAQIKQVFIAIISNAFDAMDDRGCLRIRTGWHYNKGQRFIGAEFIDDGCGIRPEDVAKIFEPFFTTKPFGQGTGLGLAVCYGIVSDHRGKIEVDSQAGRGTTMRVLLPPYAKG